jgi:predicted nuclease with RNAse H fold
MGARAGGGVKPATTLGIDLSASDAKTAACSIRWSRGTAEVLSIENGLDNSQLVERIIRHEQTAIDAPFGWPEKFIDAVREWRDEQAWSLNPWPPDSSDPARQELRFRNTDRVVAEIYRPLSVSTNLLGITAMRCASLLTELAKSSGTPVDRAGGGCVCEAYPAAALTAWSLEDGGPKLDPVGYKDRSAAARKKRRELTNELLGALGDDFGIEEKHKDECYRSDDALDALICALVARARQQGRTVEASRGAESRSAAVEGWIHLPNRAGLSSLLQ